MFFQWIIGNSRGFLGESGHQFMRKYLDCKEQTGLGWK
jgi:hypothetical protein